MAPPPVSINGSAGGTIYDQAGEVQIELGASAATVRASLGSDTILGSDGSVLVNATGNTHPLLIQPGLGNTSVFAASTWRPSHG